MDAIGELLKLGAVGLVAGLFSSVLANRDHRYRVWWEKRVAAYQEAIEALSDLVYYYDVYYNAEIEHRDLDEKFKKELEDFWGPAFHRVRKGADSGAFIFSEDANKALADFVERDYDPEEMFIEHIEKRLSAARLCLSKLIALSKSDLQLRSSFLGRFL